MSCPLLFTAIVWVALYLQLRYVQTCGFIATHTDTQSVQFRGGVLSCGLHAASGRIKSNPRSVTSELELAAEICSLMFKRQKPNKNRHSSFGIGLKNVDHPTVKIDWFIESDSSSVRRLQNRKNRNALLISFHVVLPKRCHNNDWQGGAEKVNQLLSTYHSTRECELVCPLLSYLAFSCMYKLVFSLLCPVMSSSNPSCPFHTFLAMGKGDILPSYQPPRKSKQNGMCTKLPANTQKNADSLYKSPPSLDAHNREDVHVS